MKNFIGAHHAANYDEFAELALGTPPELWLGVEGETNEERAARLDAARDILTDDPELTDRLLSLTAEVVESQAPDLFNVVSLDAARARRNRKAVAA